MGALIKALLKLFLKGASKAGKGVKIAKLGRLRFAGLNAKRPLAELTDGEIIKAFKKAGLKFSGNRNHFIQRLKERGPDAGINTLDDFARAINRGVAKQGKIKGTIDIHLRGGWKVAVDQKTGHFRTFTK